MKNKIIYKLIAGQPIDLTKYKLGIIYQPTLNYLIENDLEPKDITSFFEIVEHSYWELERKEKKLPSKFMFSLSLDNVFKDKKTNYISEFIKTLSILYRVNEADIKIEILDDNINIIIPDNKVIINENNFNRLSEVILNIFNINLSDLRKTVKEEEWVEVTGSAEEKRLIEFFKQRERERKQKELPKLFDYIRLYTSINKKSYPEVLGLTYWQLINQFESLLEVEQYKELLGYTWSYKFKIENKDHEHWMKKIKLNEDNFVNID